MVFYTDFSITIGFQKCHRNVILLGKSLEISFRKRKNDIFLKRKIQEKTSIDNEYRTCDNYVV